MSASLARSALKENTRGLSRCRQFGPTGLGGGPRCFFDSLRQRAPAVKNPRFPPSRDRLTFRLPEGRVGRVFTRPTGVAVAVGLVKTRPTLPTIRWSKSETISQLGAHFVVAELTRVQSERRSEFRPNPATLPRRVGLSRRAKRTAILAGDRFPQDESDMFPSRQNVSTKSMVKPQGGEIR